MTNDELTRLATQWIACDPDEETQQELRGLLDAEDFQELARRFGSELAFGTAGIRAVLGAGPARMNRLVVRRVSAGLAIACAEHVSNAQEQGIIVCYDARKNSRIFAEDTAAVLAGYGFQVYLAPKIAPTPVAAFATLALRAAAGVMVTASHNPPAYNGYKVYWNNGAQIIPPIDSHIAQAIDNVAIDDIKLAAQGDPKIKELPAEIVERYAADTLALRRNPDVADQDISIAYTALHGVGDELMRSTLARAGYTRFHSEPSQSQPDATFPTVSFPNPEEDGAMDRVVALGKRNRADLILANDPDADRLCVAVPNGDDGYEVLTGDQVGVLLADYLLSQSRGENRLVAASIVSSQLLGVLAEAAGAACIYTLTGFKWIANAAIARPDADFIMGYEEALGYCIGDHVRDKDGISAGLLAAEVCAYAKSRGESMLDRLHDIYRRHGLYATLQHSLTLPGERGKTQIATAMASLRDAPPQTIAGVEVSEVGDCLAGYRDLPKSNVLVYYLANSARVIVRPSGTEPKLKSYYEVREAVADGEDIATALERAERAAEALSQAHQADLNTRMPA